MKVPLPEDEHLPMEQMHLYRLYDEVSDRCWDSVNKWSVRAQRICGDQMVTAADSVCANLVEGDGRSGVADGIKFFVIARASARETRMWLVKAKKRQLISEAEFEDQIASITSATRMLNKLIAYRRKRGKFTSPGDHVSEHQAVYETDPFTESD